MGVIYANTEAEQYEELCDGIKEAVTKTLSAVGVERWGNPVLCGFEDDGSITKVKVQYGSGQSIDLSDRTILNRDYDPNVWHHASMLTMGRVEKIDEHGYITVAVIAKY